MAIRAVLFDWGGTIVHDDIPSPISPAVAVASYARSRLHFDLSDRDFERAFSAVFPTPDPARPAASPAIDALIGAAFSWLGRPVGSGDVDDCSRIFFDAAVEGQRVFDDARAILASLRHRGYRTAVVTNSIFPSRLLRLQLKELGLAGHVDATVASADVGVAKPHPGIFLRALAEIGVERHEALFVGDRLETDIAGARAAGMRAVLIERKARAHDAGGYLVIERLGALNDLLGEGIVA